MKRPLYLLILLVVLSLACNIGGSGDPSPVNTRTTVNATAAIQPTDAVNLPLPTASSTPRPTILIPTRRPDASQTPTQPSGTFQERDLDPHGPWLLIQAANGLYALNADGSGLTLLNEDTNIDLKSSLSPTGDRLAYVTMMIPGDYTTLELFLYDIGLQNLERITRLAPMNLPDTLTPDHPAFEPLRAVHDHSPPVWSPNGNQVAFMGAQDGPSSDLYLYTVATGQISRLTDGPSEGYGPTWSPDGSWIVHFGVSTFGTGAGFSMSGAWAAHVNGKDIVTLYKPTDTAAETVVGWVAPQTFMVYSWDMICGAKNLRLINAATKAATMLWPQYFDEYSFAFDPNSGRAVFSSVPGCDNTPAGFYMINVDGSYIRLSSERGYGDWSPESNLFVVRQDEAVTAYSPQGQEVSLGTAPAIVAPVAAPGGGRWAWGVTRWSGGSGLYISSGSSGPQKIHSEEVPWVTWSPDGESVIFIDSTNRLYIASAPLFFPVLIWEGIENRQDMVWAGAGARP